MRIIKTTLATLIILFAVGSAIAQDRKPIPRSEESKYVVSAKAGVINIIEGDVSYMRNEVAWSKLTSGDELREGDTVKTGANSRAEILLTPGCYLRLDENSEFILSDTSANRFKIDILEGSALIEASVIEDPMIVATPKTEFSIIQEGLYRFNVVANGRAEAVVRKGKIVHANMIVKGGKRAVFDNGALAVASYDKKDTDIFDRWSEIRAQSLLAVNRGLSNRNIRRSVQAGVSMNLWVLDTQCGCYTFLPFGSGFSSPYGGNYSVCSPFYYSYRPQPYNNENRPVNNPGSGGGSSGGGYPGSGGGHSGGGHSGGGGGGVITRPTEPPPRFDPGERNSVRERPQPVNNGGRRP